MVAVPFILRPRPCRPPLRATLLIATLAAAWPVLAQSSDAAAEPPKGQGSWNGPLQTSATLQEVVPQAEAERRPVYLSGDSMEGQQNDALHVRGNAGLRRADASIHADELRYVPATQQATASGNVRIDAAGDRFQGRELKLNVETYEGYFDQARYQLRENQAHGESSRVDFINRDQYVVHEADYTTCQRDAHDPNWRPAWRIRARELTLDRTADEGVARGAKLEFMGVPILPVPYLSFPLSDRRKTGLLAPTIGLDSVSGLQYEQPFYWNIAPNRDATLSTTLMARRGVNLGGEFRYLEQNFSGELAGRFMPSDSLRERDRWSTAVRHRHRIDSPVGDVNIDVNLNRVSDDNYWRDFPRSSYGLAERLLPSEVNARWERDDWRLRLRTLKWQTLQDIDSVILPPYDMLPQLNLRYAPWNMGAGMDFTAEFDTTRFRADRNFLSQLSDGDRSYAKLNLSRPWIAPQGFFTPSVQLHASHYRFDQPLSDGSTSHSRVVPTYSLDGGLVFERDTNLFGRNLLQTLEPRALYTYTPFRNQNQLPIYDTGELDFTFASIYSPDSFVGNDRFADNNLLTLGLTSRLLAADDGAELARASIAQRMRFKDQLVTMPGESAYEKGWSDILLGGNVNWTKRWATSGVIQYDFDQRRSVRYTLTGHYKPGEFRVLSAGYRMKRDASKQAEFGWQWPLSALWGDGGANSNGPWYSVGRLNYSMQDRKLVDTIIGMEYNGCCWVGRVVVERLQNSWQTSNTRVLFQLELAGLSRVNVGSNPLTSLRSNIPYYEEVRPQQPQPSSRFTHYE